MNQAYFKKLFEFDFWANEKELHTLGDMESPDREAIKKISHVLLAKKLWLSRLTPEVPAPDMSCPLSIPECLSLNHEIREKTNGYLSKITEEQISGKVAYKNLKGVPQETVLADILTQLVTHGTYHRGQIAMLIKKSGGTPPETDYVRFAANMA